MTTQPRGIRRLAGLGPWRLRGLRLLATWLAFVLVAAVLGLEPAVAQIGAILLAGAAVVWYLVDHWPAHRTLLWPLVDATVREARRGSDVSVEGLAARLEAAERHREERPEVTRRLHEQLCAIIRERLYTKHGITIEEEPKWAEGVMPPELWDFLTGLPDPALYSPAHLDQILRRIEQW